MDQADRIDYVLASGIGNFLTARWGEAREALTSLDPAYMQTIMSWSAVEDVDLQLPDAPPEPNHRLSDDWHYMLEATVEVVHQVDRIYQTVERALSATNWRDASYYTDTWVEAAYSTKVHSLGRRKEKYTQGVIQVRDRVGDIRQGLVPGIRGCGGHSSDGITEDRLWESSLALGVSSVLKWMPDPAHESPPEWIRGMPEATRNLLIDLGDALDGLTQDIQRYTGSY